MNHRSNFSAAAFTFLVIVAVLASGCQDSSSSTTTSTSSADAAPVTPDVPAAATPQPADPPASASPAPSDAAAAKRPAGEAGLLVAPQRAQLMAKRSDLGTVLFDANGQVVYAFEQDSRDRSRCTSAECVKAWPPMLTKDAPNAGAGINAKLLGTIKRADGKVQVTYNGRPLYFYEHEAPGEIKCHNVNIHGGLWWVVTAAGAPLST